MQTLHSNNLTNNKCSLFISSLLQVFHYKVVLTCMPKEEESPVVTNDNAVKPTQASPGTTSTVQIHAQKSSLAMLKVERTFVYFRMNWNLTLSQWRAFNHSLHTLWVSKANEMHQCLPIGVDSENTCPYLLVAERAHTVTADPHNRFPLVVEFILDLFYKISCSEKNNKRGIFKSYKTWWKY